MLDEVCLHVSRHTLFLFARVALTINHDIHLHPSDLLLLLSRHDLYFAHEIHTKIHIDIEATAILEAIVVAWCEVQTKRLIERQIDRV